MEKEYESLRLETLQWQSRRFDIIAGSIIGVTAMLGWIVSSPNSWSWAVASILPLSFLCSTCFLTCLFNRSITLIGTYLEVFHEDGWSARVRRMRLESRFQILTLTSGFIQIYFGLGIISIVLSYVICLKKSTKAELLLFCIISILFLLMLVVLYTYSYPRKQYILLWKQFKDEEMIKAESA